MAELSRDGARIHWQVDGPVVGGPGVGELGSGRPASAQRLPVLLSHGFGETGRMWQPNLPALSAERAMITWDLRGHGDSEVSPGGACTQEACIADLVAVLDAAGAGRAVIGGLSLGGYLSLAFWQAHPERVAALMLFDTGPGFRNDEARQQWNDRALRTADRLERSGLAAAGGVGAGHKSAVGLAQAARGILTQRDGRVMESLPAIDVPVLVLVGARDRAFLGAADYMARKISGASLVEIPDAGHLSNVDQPELFNAAVLAFLDRIDPLV